MKNKISKQVALITGGTKGIGYGVAEALMAQGGTAVITGRHEGAVSEAVDSLNGKGLPGRADGVVADVRDMAAQEAAVAHVLATFGRLDVLVANAGIGHFAAIEDLTAERWQETIDVNLTGVFYSVKAALAALRESKGYIITIASLAGTNFFAKGSAYNASKFGLVGFTQALMLDVRQYGIKTTTIMPGSVATYFNDHQPSEADAWKIQPEDIGQMVADLLNMHERTLPSKVEVRPTMVGK